MIIAARSKQMMIYFLTLVESDAILFSIQIVMLLRIKKLIMEGDLIIVINSLRESEWNVL